MSRRFRVDADRERSQRAGRVGSVLCRSLMRRTLENSPERTAIRKTFQKWPRAELVEGRG